MATISRTTTARLEAKMKFRREFFVLNLRDVAGEISGQPGDAQQQQRQPGLAPEGRQPVAEPQGRPGQDQQQEEVVAVAQELFHGHLHFLNSNTARVR